MKSPQVLYSTLAIHMHAQQIALALHTNDWLGEWQTEGLDLFSSPVGQWLRQSTDHLLPKVSRLLAKRQLQVTIPASHINNRWRWELSRTMVKQFGKYPLMEDWLWEKSEYALDHRASRKLHLDRYDVFMGTEFGALESIKTAQQLGKKSILIFTSPHHATRQKWMEPVYDQHYKGIDKYQQKLYEKSFNRDQRRDEEAHGADYIHTSSNFTRDSLVDAGIDAQKIKVAPLGGPVPLPQITIQRNSSATLNIICVGNLALHKGTHLLLEAWKRVKPKNAALHLYGRSQLNDLFLNNIDESVSLHGFIGREELSLAYHEADVLFFPTLCDGFGMVISEALAHGCPVITTSNAGGADYVRPGKNGFIIQAGDVEAIQEKIIWCLDNRAELQAMRKQAWESAHLHTWEHFRQKLTQDLREWLE